MKTRTYRKTNTRTNGAVLQEEATEYRAISPTRHSSPATPADRLENFGIYRLARQLFDEFWSDSEVLGRDFRGKELARQQVRSLDSICANIEEGYGRGFGKELPQHLRIARGEVRESKGRFERCKYLLSAEVIGRRVQILDHIIGGLTNTIRTLEKKQSMKGQSKVTCDV